MFARGTGRRNMRCCGVCGSGVSGVMHILVPVALGTMRGLCMSSRLAVFQGECLQIDVGDSQGSPPAW